MDVLSLIGLILAFVAIVGGNFLEGGHVGALINGPAGLIVLGGTLAAALLQSPPWPTATSVITSSWSNTTRVTMPRLTGTVTTAKGS